jgi:hypothetical protein
VAVVVGLAARHRLEQAQTNTTAEEVALPITRWLVLVEVVQLARLATVERALPVGLALALAAHPVHPMAQLEALVGQLTQRVTLAARPVRAAVAPEIA